MGPLDLVRQLNDKAGEYDVYATLSMQDEYEAPKFQQQVHNLNASHPLIGEEVSVYGDAITSSIDEEGREFTGVVSPAMNGDSPELVRVDREYLDGAIGEHHMPVVGEYAGYEIWKAFDIKQGAWVHRVTHKVSVGSVEYVDPYGNDHLITQNRSVCALGSKIFPVNPVNAHSLRDLRDDKVVHYAFDNIVFHPDNSPVDAIIKIGKIARKVFSGDRENPELNHQRISYLNSMGLLDGISILTRDFLQVTGYPSEGDVTSQPVQTERFVQIEPGFFVLGKKYHRDTQGNVYCKPGEIDLGVKTPTGDGEAIVVPVPNIEGFAEPLR